MGVVDFVFNELHGFYITILNIIPQNLQASFAILILALGVAVVSLFIWYFYKSLSKKDLVTLDLSKYNTTESPGLSKFLAVLLYLIENFFIMPLLIFFWFVALSFVLLLIANESTVQGILLLTAVMVTAIRILAYAHGEISQDLAKLFPFITLSVFLLTPGAFDFGTFVLRSSETAQLFSQIFSYMFVIFIVEIVLRVLSTFKRLWSGEEKFMSN